MSAGGSVVLSGVAQARAVVSSVLGPHLVRTLDGELHGSLRYVTCSRVLVAEVSYGAPEAVELTFPALLDRYLVFLPGTGAVTVRMGEEEVPIDAGRGACPGLAEACELRLDAGASLRVLRVARDAVQDSLSAALRRPVFGLPPLNPTVRLDGPQAGALLEIIALVERLVAVPGGMSPWSESLLEALMTGQLLQVLSHEHGAALAADGGVRLSAPVLAAVELVAEQARGPLQVRDLAAAAQVSVRSLQAAFVAELGTTPMAYVRAVRLRGAHAELVEGAPFASVTAVAMRWRFFHVGRFAEEYRRAYGVPPSVTARAGGPGAASVDASMAE